MKLLKSSCNRNCLVLNYISELTFSEDKIVALKSFRFISKSLSSFFKLNKIKIISVVPCIDWSPTNEKIYGSSCFKIYFSYNNRVKHFDILVKTIDNVLSIKAIPFERKKRKINSSQFKLENIVNYDYSEEN